MDENPRGPLLLDETLAMALENMPVAVTLVDPWGTILYFNRKAAEILDRRPEYLGRDVRFCHAKPESVAKIEAILADFRAGSDQMVEYEAVRHGRKRKVSFTPLRRESNLMACLQTVVEAGAA